ncbi:MAG: FAD-dependent monooxygenase [Wigglesworthia glossinidia]|nr:FAD-dependent monooxygenase [Wigglesworthia glossinidia]
MKNIFDIAIIGSGTIGNSLALKLSQSGFLIKLIEIKPQVKNLNYEIPDFRVLALNTTAIQFLKDINIWQKIDKNFYNKFKYLETWHSSFSKVRFCSKMSNFPRLGVVLENYRLNQELVKNINLNLNIHTKYCAKLHSMHYISSKSVWKINYSDGSSIFSNMIIGADGQDSWVRKQSGIPFFSFKYNQSCMLIIAKLKIKSEDTVWQSLHINGPRALLPLYKSWSLLIWYDNSNYLNQLQKMSIQEIEKKIINIFPKKLGPISIYKHIVVPLNFLYGYQYVKNNLALVGDALHTIHPLAGQGANLGFRDIKILSDILIYAKYKKLKWHDISVLKQYEDNCRMYNTAMQFGIETFRLLFSSRFILKKNIYCPIFNMVESSYLLKNILIKYASGVF